MGRARTGSIVVQDGRINARVTYMGEDGKRHAIWRAAKNRTHARQLIPEIIQLLEEQRPSAYGGKRNNRRGFIYAIQMQSSDAPVKIGFAVNVQDRINTLSVGSPYPLIILGYWETAHGRLEEKKLHDQFQDSRLLGEWFAQSEELLAEIRTRTDNYRTKLTNQVADLGLYVAAGRAAMRSLV